MFVTLYVVSKKLKTVKMFQEQRTAYKQKNAKESTALGLCATVSPNEWILCWAPVPTWPELCHVIDNGQGKTPDTVQSTLDHLCAKGLVCGLSRTMV